MQSLGYFVIALFAEFNDVFCNILTNSYLVEFNQPTDRSIANNIARRNGFINVGSVSLFILKSVRKMFKKNISD